MLSAIDVESYEDSCMGLKVVNFILSGELKVHSYL